MDLMITAKQLRTKKFAAWINLVSGLLWVIVAIRNYQGPQPTDWLVNSAVAALFLFVFARSFWQLRQ